MKESSVLCAHGADPESCTRAAPCGRCECWQRINGTCDCPARGSDLRALIAARRETLSLTRAALAQRLAPRWGLPNPDSAETALYRFERGRGELTAERLADVLDALGLTVTANVPTQTANAATRKPRSGLRG